MTVDKVDRFLTFAATCWSVLISLSVTSQAQWGKGKQTNNVESVLLYKQ